MKVLIAGGAGYIGSTVASAFIDVGITPVIIDNFSTGRTEFVRNRVFYRGDISDINLINRIFIEHPDIEAALLSAALIAVPESFVQPLRYYTENVVKSLAFVSGLISNGCNRLIFSSSASIYHSSNVLEVDESSIISPQSPYARTKATCEAMFHDIANASELRILSLRYFNPIGADPKLRTGLQLARPSHVLGQMILAMQTGSIFSITGTDYETRDGTGIRDYVHVWDLARAHVTSLIKFENIFGFDRRFEVINLGTGVGTTVRELTAAFNSVVENPIEVIDAPRRPGDIAGSYASLAKAERLLSWTPEFSIKDGVRSSIEWSEIRSERLGV